MDGLDDDRDGLVDCRDPDCENCEAVCDDGLDDDDDGRVDCADSDCRTALWIGTCVPVQDMICPRTPGFTFREDFDADDLVDWVQFDPVPPVAPAVVQPPGYLDWQGAGEDNLHGSSMATAEAWTLVPGGLSLRFGVSLPWTQQEQSRAIQVGLGRLPSFEPEPAVDSMESYVKAAAESGIWEEAPGGVVGIHVGSWGSEATTITPMEFHDIEVAIDEDGFASLSVDSAVVAEAPFAVEGIFDEARIVIHGHDIHPTDPDVPEAELLIDYIEMSTPGGRPVGCAWGNPVLEPVGGCECCPPAPGVPGEEGLGCAFDGLEVGVPSVVRDGTEYLMFFAGSSGTGQLYGSNVGLARSADGYEWTKHTDEDGTPVPVMWSYLWDDVMPEELIGIYEPFVMVDGEDLIAYVVLSLAEDPGIGRATSDDGGVTWTLDTATPRFMGREGEWDDALIGRASVIASDSGYLMAYGARASIGLVRGNDGRTWDDATRREIPELRPQFEGQERKCPWLMRAGERLVMLFDRRGGFEGSVIDLVYSDDEGETWQELPGNPLLRARAGDNVQGVSCPSAILEGDLLRVWYSSAPNIGYAEFDLRDVPVGTP